MGMMDEVIDAAVAECGGETDSWDVLGYARGPCFLRLEKALAITGPLWRGGRVYRLGEGETYRQGIEVIGGVRDARDVTAPEGVAAIT